MLQLRADNQRMQRTIARNGLQDDDAETSDHSPEGDTNATLSLQKKLSIGDPTTFGLSLLCVLRYQENAEQYVITVIE